MSGAAMHNAVLILHVANETHSRLADKERQKIPLDVLIAALP